MVTLGTGTSGTRFLKTNYPFEKGLIAGTTSQTGNIEFLEYEKSFVEEKDKEFLSW